MGLDRFQTFRDIPDIPPPAEQVPKEQRHVDDGSYVGRCPADEVAQKVNLSLAKKDGEGALSCVMAALKKKGTDCVSQMCSI